MGMTPLFRFSPTFVRRFLCAVLCCVCFDVRTWQDWEQRKQESVVRESEVADALMLDGIELPLLHLHIIIMIRFSCW